MKNKEHEHTTSNKKPQTREIAQRTHNNQELRTQTNIKNTENQRTTIQTKKNNFKQQIKNKEQTQRTQERRTNNKNNNKTNINLI